VLLDEQQIKFVTKGQRTRIKLDAEPSRTIESQVESIGVSDQSITKQQRQSSDDPRTDRGELPDLITELVAAHKKPEIQYFARVPIQPGDVELKIGLSGQARLFTGYRSLGARLIWWVNQNFRS
jgi:hypothetical protein